MHSPMKVSEVAIESGSKCYMNSQSLNSVQTSKLIDLPGHKINLHLQPTIYSYYDFTLGLVLFFYIGHCLCHIHTYIHTYVIYTYIYIYIYIYIHIYVYIYIYIYIYVYIERDRESECRESEYLLKGSAKTTIIKCLAVLLCFYRSTSC